MPETLSRPSRADRYRLAVRSFLGDSDVSERYLGGFSPETKRVYAHAVTEFFEWIEMDRGYAVSPEDVTSADAEAYVHHLANRDTSVVRRQRLRKNGQLRERDTIYDAVSALEQGNRKQVARMLPPALADAHPGEGGVDLDWLAGELGALVESHLLVRSPTLEELREQDKRPGIRIGVDEHAVAVREGGDRRVVALDDIFVYRIAPSRPLSRSSICLRVSALSALWESMTLPHDQNAPLLQHNVFAAINRRVHRGVSNEKKLAAQLGGWLTADSIEKLMAATSGSRLTDKRDAALLWYLIFTGSRVTAAVQLKRGLPPTARERTMWRGWFDSQSEPPCVIFTKKGEVKMRLPYPPAALASLFTFQAALREKAAPKEAQSRDPKAPHYIKPTSARWLYQKLAHEPDAPLFPSVSFWGRNAGEIDYRKPMRRNSVGKMLRRIGKKAGLSDEQLLALHPHAVRHFSATAMARGGKDLREVQQILGHESIRTTESYLEDESDPVVLSGQAAIFAYLARAKADDAKEADRRLVQVSD